MKITETKNQGITLIALVITIIVLLILAAVSIAMLTGDNGIFTQANNAQKESEIEEAKERAKMDIMAWQSNELENGRNGKIDDTIIYDILRDNKEYVKEAKEHSFISKKGNYEISYEELYQKVNIEEGTEETSPYLPSDDFAYVEETNLSMGLVMEEKTKKNRYTWIEVPRSIYKNKEYNEGKEPENSEDYEKIESIMQKYAQNYQGKYADEWQSKEQHGFATALDYNNQKNKMLKSVYEHGGFWIGQYEIGYEENNIRTAKTADSGLTQVPVSKEGAYPYNWITCKQAQQLVQRLNSGRCEKSLLFGIQWDLVLKHLETKGKWDTNDYPAEWYLKTDSESWGNYYNSDFSITKGKYSIDNGNKFIVSPQSGYQKTKSIPALLTTGASDRNCCLNIYDLAGNVYEWTLEKTTTVDKPCSQRGGGYNYGKTTGIVWGRSYNATDYAQFNVGFRATFY